MANWYYYSKNGEKVGPISATALKELAQRGLITKETKLENNGGRIALAGQVNGLVFPEKTLPPKMSSPTPSPVLAVRDEVVVPAVSEEVYGFASPSPMVDVNPFATIPATADHPFAAPMAPTNDPFATYVPTSPTAPRLAPVPIVKTTKKSAKPLIVAGIISVGVVFLIGIFAALYWAKTGVALPELYKDSEYGFSFRYPKDWSESPMQAMGVHAAVAGQPDAGFAPNVNVVLLPPNKDILKTTKEDIQKEYETIFQNVNIKNFEIRKIGGKECLFCHYQGTLGEGVHVEQLQFLFQHGDKTFIVTLSDSQANFRKNRSLFNSIAGSFRFERLTAEKQEKNDKTDDKNVPPQIAVQKLYEDSEYGFSFRYPKIWSESPMQAMGVHVAVAGQPDAGFAPNVNVVLLPLNKDILNTTKEDLQKEYETICQNLNIKNFGIRKIGGKESLFCHYQGTLGEGVHVEQLQFLFLHGDKTFIVTLSDSQANFSKNRSLFNAIADSFRFERLTAEVQEKNVPSQIAAPEVNEPADAPPTKQQDFFTADIIDKQIDVLIENNDRKDLYPMDRLSTSDRQAVATYMMLLQEKRGKKHNQYDLDRILRKLSKIEGPFDVYKVNKAHRDSIQDSRDSLGRSRNFTDDEKAKLLPEYIRELRFVESLYFESKQLCGDTYAAELEKERLDKIKRENEEKEKREEKQRREAAIKDVF